LIPKKRNPMEIKKHTNLQSTADMFGGPTKVSKITTGVIAMMVMLTRD
jgi:hypothetical protein